MQTTTYRRSSSSNLAELSQQLDRINDELQYEVESELDRLRDEERLLQSALKLKTRHDLINSMEKELEMDAFGRRDMTDNQTALMLTANDLNDTRTRNNNYVSSVLSQYETLNSSNSLSRSIDLSDDSLRQSNRILDKLITEYSNTLRDGENRTATTNELLRSAAFGTDYKNQYAHLNQSELVRPNVVYATKSRPIKYKTTTYRVYSTVPTTVQDLNNQQTLRDDINFMTRSMLRSSLTRPQTSMSVTDLNRSLADLGFSLDKSMKLNEREIARTIRDNYYLNDTNNRATKTRSSLNNLKTSSSFRQNNTSQQQSLTLPVSKTLVHARPWVPGHVDNSIYYPYRSSKIKRDTTKKTSLLY